MTVPIYIHALNKTRGKYIYLISKKKKRDLVLNYPLFP